MEERRKYPQSAMGKKPGERRKSGMLGRREEAMKCVYAGPGYFKKQAKTEGGENERSIKKPGAKSGTNLENAPKANRPDVGENYNV